jgi:aryl-alcohol dehydrogenase-like predicted oxidoreductase
LQAGETLDGEGGYTVWGKLVPAERSLAEGALPIGLAHKVPLKRNIAAGAVVRWADVDVPGQRGVADTPRHGAALCVAVRRHRGAMREARMEFRQFGRTDLKVSAVGFGCWEIGGTYGRIDEGQFQRAVVHAIDSGITCFDTAEAYGMGVSEEALARALGGRRNDVVIATKFGVGYEEMPNRRDSSRERVLASIDKSLQRLRTDHVDIYLVHWPDPNTPLEETMRALDDVVRQGKARFVGVSNFRLAQIEECARLRRIDVVQYAWNMFDRRMQAEIFPYCAAQQIAVMAYGSLAYGMLSGTFHAGMSFDENDWRSRGGNLGSLNLFRTLFGPEHFLRNVAAVEVLKRLAVKYGKSLPQFALGWTLSNPVVGAALVGFRTFDEVTENLGALGWEISNADMAEIDAILARHGAVTVPPGWLED